MVVAVSDISPAQFILAVIVAAALSMWVYWHASHHGSKHATAWGACTFLAVGIVLPIYFIHYYVTRRRF